MPSAEWITAWKRYQRNGLPSPEEIRGPAVRVSQYEKAVQRWRESINDDAWTEHLDKQAGKSRESRLEEAEARAADLLT